MSIVMEQEELPEPRRGEMCFYGFHYHLRHVSLLTELSKALQFFCYKHFVPPGLELMGDNMRRFLRARHTRRRVKMTVQKGSAGSLKKGAGFLMPGCLVPHPPQAGSRSETCPVTILDGMGTRRSLRYLSTLLLRSRFRLNAKTRVAWSFLRIRLYEEANSMYPAA